MEYQKLETRVATLNRALKDLTQVLHDWDSFTFVEVRTVCLLARLPACPPARLPACLPGSRRSLVSTYAHCSMDADRGCTYVIVLGTTANCSGARPM